MDEFVDHSSERLSSSPSFHQHLIENKEVGLLLLLLFLVDCID